MENKFGGIEQWSGNLGPGILNALHATETVMKLAKQHGIGCVALRNTNHWMRGGHLWMAGSKGWLCIYCLDKHNSQYACLGSKRCKAWQ